MSYSKSREICKCNTSTGKILKGRGLLWLISFSRWGDEILSYDRWVTGGSLQWRWHWGNDSGWQNPLQKDRCKTAEPLFLIALSSGYHVQGEAIKSLPEHNTFIPFLLWLGWSIGGAANRNIVVLTQYQEKLWVQKGRGVGEMVLKLGASRGENRRKIEILSSEGNVFSLNILPLLWDLCGQSLGCFGLSCEAASFYSESEKTFGESVSTDREEWPYGVSV